jgi:sugar O-acyltransferase (sialic acid O-acetyltransferase NeuD family)
MKKSLYLIGAGDLGREIESWLELLPNFHHNWVIKGYLDQNPNALKNYPSEYKVLGDPLNFEFNKEDFIAICLTNPADKQHIIEEIKGKVNFFSYIAPNTIMGKYVNLGTGVIVCPNSCISTNVTLEDFVFINAGTQIGHDCKLGAYSSLMAHVDLGGKVQIGQKVFMGTKSNIIPGVKVTDNVTIGTGSIVVHDIKTSGTYFGNPAKRLC